MMPVNQSESLIEEEATVFSLTKFNSRLKFTPVMEEVLLTLLFFVLLSGEIKFSKIGRELCQLLDRSPNAVGSALKALADLQLLAYYREGKGMTVKLHLDHPFLFSLLLRFFGLKQISEKHRATEDCLAAPLGFVPTTRDYRAAIQTFHERNELLKAKRDEYRDWVKWAEQLQELERLATDKEEEKEVEEGQEREAEESCPFRRVSAKIVSRIDQQARKQVTSPSVEQLTTIVTELLAQKQACPPGEDGWYLRQQKSSLINELTEERLKHKKQKQKQQEDEKTAVG
ncbi:MAG: hypothetical protein GF308_06985 [Candidatus Heimdallarchaeota archaeon]|nr:hypothetical protein [Candidatus Heimdallarchaeota archaeon]